MEKSDVKVLHDRVAFLESRVDMLEAEIIHLNRLLIQFGFSKGIESLKQSIQELLDLDATFLDNPSSENNTP